MKGTPCSRGYDALLKVLWKARYLRCRVNPAKRVRAWVDNGQAVPAENNDTVFIHVDGLKVSRGAAEQGSHGHAMRIASGVGLSQAAAP